MTKQAAVDWNTVLHVLGAGGVAGLGTGAAVAFMNHLNTLQQKAEKSQDTSADDNIAYVNLLPRNKMASANNASTFALAGTAGLAGLFGAYNLVRAMHQNMRKKQLQQELDQSQQIYLGGLSNSKQASQFSGLTKLVGSGYLATLLAGAGSAVIANRILSKQFPALENPDRDRPKRIVIRTLGRNGLPAGDDDVMNESANASPEETEALLRTHLGNPKAARDSGFEHLVNQVAAGKSDSIKGTIREYGATGVVSVLDSTDAVPLTKEADTRRHMAISWIAHDPLVSRSIQPILAAEFMDWTPGLMKLAASLDCDDSEVCDALVGLSVAASQGVREVVFADLCKTHCKSAEDHEVGGPLKALVMAGALERLLNDKGEAGSGTSNTPTSVDSPTPKGTRVSANDPNAASFARKNLALVENAAARVT